jgi:hypothetical protein
MSDMTDDDDLDEDDFFVECPLCMIPVCEGCGCCHVCEGDDDEDDEEEDVDDDA